LKFTTQTSVNNTEKEITMEKFKKWVAYATFIAMIATSAHNLTAQTDFEYNTDTGGYGYEQSRRVPSLAPAIALGTIALVAIIAVAVQNSSHHNHGHAHGHSN
jgi:hypothetical protein